MAFQIKYICMQYCCKCLSELHWFDKKYISGIFRKMKVMSYMYWPWVTHVTIRRPSCPACLFKKKNDKPYYIVYSYPPSAINQSNWSPSSEAIWCVADTRRITKQYNTACLFLISNLIMTPFGIILWKKKVHNNSLPLYCRIVFRNTTGSWLLTQ